MSLCGCVIPVYRHFEELRRLLPGVVPFFPNKAVVVVDDGSEEPLKIPDLSHSEKEITLITHKRNMGKGAALLSGMKKLRDMGFEYALCMDADGQHSPDDIPAFLENLGKADILIGNRMGNLKGMPIERRLSNKITSAMVRFKSGLPVRDSQNGFRLVRIDAILGLELAAGGFQFESEMLLKGGEKGLTLMNIPVKTIYEGSFSSIRHFSDTWKFIRLILRKKER